MIARILIAGAGAVVMTGALLLAMDNMTSLFENRSTERFYRITDILPKPEPGRPDRPAPARRQPAGVAPEAAEADVLIPLELPELSGADAPLLAEPELTGFDSPATPGAAGDAPADAPGEPQR